MGISRDGHMTTKICGRAISRKILWVNEARASPELKCSVRHSLMAALGAPSVNDGAIGMILAILVSPLLLLTSVAHGLLEDDRVARLGRCEHLDRHPE